MSRTHYNYIMFIYVSSAYIPRLSQIKVDVLRTSRDAVKRRDFNLAAELLQQ